MELDVNRALRVVIEHTLPRQLQKRLEAAEDAIKEIEENFDVYAKENGFRYCPTCRDAGGYLEVCKCGAKICQRGCGRFMICCGWVCGNCCEPSQCDNLCHSCIQHQHALWQCDRCSSRLCNRHNRSICHQCKATLCAGCSETCACGKHCCDQHRIALRAACPTCLYACEHCMETMYHICSQCKNKYCEHQRCRCNSMKLRSWTNGYAGATLVVGGLIGSLLLAAQIKHLPSFETFIGLIPLVN